MCIIYVQRVAAETENEETEYPQEKDRMKQTMSKSKSKKGRKRRKKKSQHLERKKEDRAQGEYTCLRLAKSAERCSAETK